MKRWWLVIGLLLSIGLNVGLLAGRLAGSAKSHVDHSIEAPIEDLGGEATRVDQVAEPSSDLPNDGQTDAQTPHAGVRTGALPPPLERRLSRLVTRMADDLRLEGTERARFEEIQMRFFRRSVAARHEARRLQNRLRRELGSAQPERHRAEVLLERTMARQVEVEAAFVDAYFETHALLDAERFERYRRILVRMRRMRDEIGRRLDASRRPSSAVESERTVDGRP